MDSIFLQSTIKQLQYYKAIGEKTFAQLKEEQLFVQINTESNSIAIIVQHLSGNMLSRWTDFLTSDGEKDWRNRDEEFENIITTKEELILKWEQGWTCLFTALNNLTDQDLNKEIFIRNEGQTVIDAINRQLAHYPYHIGQIVFIAKILCSNNWQSLSIPKGQSVAFNVNKFAQPKLTKKE